MFGKLANSYILLSGACTTSVLVAGTSLSSDWKEDIEQSVEQIEAFLIKSCLRKRYLNGNEQQSDPRFSPISVFYNPENLYIGLETESQDKFSNILFCDAEIFSKKYSSHKFSLPTLVKKALTHEHYVINSAVQIAEIVSKCLLENNYEQSERDRKIMKMVFSNESKQNRDHSFETQQIETHMSQPLNDIRLPTLVFKNINWYFLTGANQTNNAWDKHLLLTNIMFLREFLNNNNKPSQPLEFSSTTDSYSHLPKYDANIILCTRSSSLVIDMASAYNTFSKEMSSQPSISHNDDVDETVTNNTETSNNSTEGDSDELSDSDLNDRLLNSLKWLQEVQVEFVVFPPIPQDIKTEYVQWQSRQMGLNLSTSAAAAIVKDTLGSIPLLNQSLLQLAQCKTAISSHNHNNNNHQQQQQQQQRKHENLGPGEGVPERARNEFFVGSSSGEGPSIATTAEPVLGIPSIASRSGEENPLGSGEGKEVGEGEGSDEWEEVVQLAIKMSIQSSLCTLFRLLGFDVATVAADDNDTDQSEWSSGSPHDGTGEGTDEEGGRGYLFSLLKYYINPYTNDTSLTPNQQIFWYEFMNFLIDKRDTPLTPTMSLQLPQQPAPSPGSHRSSPYTCTIQELVEFCQIRGYSGLDLEQLLRIGLIQLLPIVRTGGLSGEVVRGSERRGEDGGYSRPLEIPVQVERMVDINPFSRCEISGPVELILALKSSRQSQPFHSPYVEGSDEEIFPEKLGNNPVHHHPVTATPQQLLEAMRTRSSILDFKLESEQLRNQSQLLSKEFRDILLDQIDLREKCVEVIQEIKSSRHLQQQQQHLEQQQQQLELQLELQEKTNAKVLKCISSLLNQVRAEKQLISLVTELSNRVGSHEGKRKELQLMVNRIGTDLVSNSNDLEIINSDQDSSQVEVSEAKRTSHKKDPYFNLDNEEKIKKFVDVVLAAERDGRLGRPIFLASDFERPRIDILKSYYRNMITTVRGAVSIFHEVLNDEQFQEFALIGVNSTIAISIFVIWLLDQS